MEFFDQALKDNEPFHIVLTDYKMPSADGAQVIRHIMKTHPVPIIVLSAFKEAEMVDFIQEGAILFLPKPFQLKRISEAIQTALHAVLEE